MYRIIDGHVHIYPDKIARKACESIAAFYDLPKDQASFDGTVGTLLRLGDENGISRFLVHSVATNAAQVTHINDYIARECVSHPRFIGFATMHPDFPHPGDELSRIRAMGLNGVKMHPDFQQFDISSPRLDAAYEAMQALDLPVLLHMGDPRYDRSAPFHIPIVRRRFPHLKIICAHFGGYMRWQEAAECLKGQDVWIDTCSSLFALSPEAARAYIDLYGHEKVIFGSDYPMWDVKKEIGYILNLGLSEELNRKIFAENLEALLGIQ